MIAAVKPACTSTTSWHNAFLAMLPQIRCEAEFAFRSVAPEEREELVSEVIANACCAFARLWQRKCESSAHATVLARFAIRQIRCGRKVGSRRNVNDVSSPYSQRRKGVAMERLERRAENHGGWQEILVEDPKAGPAEIAAIRIDFAAWLASLSRTRREVAQCLAFGETPGVIACNFRLSRGRISQLRRELKGLWDRFHANALA